MNKVGLGAAVALLMLGTVAVAQPQDQAKPEEKPPAHENEAKPAKPPKETTPPRADSHKPSPNRVNEGQQKAAQQDAKRSQDQAKQVQKNQSKQVQQNQENAKRVQQDNARRATDKTRIAQNQSPAAHGEPARGGNRIPDDKFRAHFGQGHHFHVGHPVMVDNRPRFQYSGYWFEFANAWPAGWSYDDDCYIDYIDDGYYLFDPVHPGVRIAITIVM